MAVWYVSTVAHAAVTQWAASTAYSVGNLRRQLATPTLNNERVFRCTTAGTSGGTEPTWNLGTGATTNDGTAVWTEVTGNSTYGWTAAISRLLTAFNSKTGNGDTIYISQDHDENNTANVTYQCNSVQNNPTYVICVNRAGSVPPVSADITTGALIKTTGAFNIDFRTVGAWEVTGVTVRAGIGSSSTVQIQLAGNARVETYKNCRFEIASTGASSTIRMEATVTWDNVTTKFAATGQCIYAAGRWIWQNSTAVDNTGSIPTNLVNNNNEPLVFRGAGLDLNALGANSMFNTGGNPNVQLYDFINCKFSSSYTISTPALLNGARVQYTNCDNGSTNYKSGSVDYSGTESTETTIVRTGSTATDGTTPVSKKIVTTGNSSNAFPFRARPIYVWGDTTGGAKTITVYGITGGTIPNNDELWIEVEYLGTSGDPRSLIATSGLAERLATPVALTSDSSTWGGSTTKFRTAVTVTPQKKGLFAITVCAAKTSTTYYVDPAPVVT